MSIRKRTWTNAKGDEKTAWIVDYVDGEGDRTIKTFSLKKEADAYLAKARVEVSEGVHVADSKSVSVKEAGDAWILTCKNSGLEKSTIESYQLHLDRHITPFIGRVLLSKLSVPVIRAFQDQLRSGNPSLDDGALRKEPRSPAMVKRVTVSLGGILADAMERGVASRNAVREMAKGRRKGKERQGERRQKARLRAGVDIPTPQEISLILGAVQGRYRPFLLTAIFTGLRASELRGLRWSDVDFAEKVLHVRQRADKFHEIGMPKSDAGQRTIPLPPTVLNTLREWKLECPKGELDLVFPNGEGNIEWHANIIKRGLLPAQLEGRRHRRYRREGCRRQADAAGEVQRPA